MTAVDAAYGVRSAVAPLRRALLVAPTLEGDFAAAGWRQPDAELLRRQHESFCELLASLGVEVEVLPAQGDGLVDSCFAYDPVFMTGGGAIVFRMAKDVRRAEPPRLAAAFERLGVPVAGTLGGEAVADGGDLLWLDASTVLLGRGYRTNAEGQRQVGQLLAAQGVAVERFDLPHHLGPGFVLHLLSVISPIADDLAAVFEPLAPVPLLELLRERGIRWLPVPPDELDTQGGNLLAVRPGVVVLAAGNPGIRRLLEAEGCEVHEYEASELNKGDGGPTCLTQPLLRA